jgi:hypothetical protein
MNKVIEKDRQNYLISKALTLAQPNVSEEERLEMQSMVLMEYPQFTEENMAKLKKQKNSLIELNDSLSELLDENLIFVGTNKDGTRIYRGLDEDIH